MIWGPDTNRLMNRSKPARVSIRRSVTATGRSGIASAAAFILGRASIAAELSLAADVLLADWENNGPTGMGGAGTDFDPAPIDGAAELHGLLAERECGRDVDTLSVDNRCHQRAKFVSPNRNGWQRHGRRRRTGRHAFRFGCPGSVVECPDGSSLHRNPRRGQREPGIVYDRIRRNLQYPRAAPSIGWGRPSTFRLSP